MAGARGIGDLAAVGDLRPGQQDERAQRGLDLGPTFIKLPVRVHLPKRNHHDREPCSFGL
jgi:hypothetical protein